MADLIANKNNVIEWFYNNDNQWVDNNNGQWIPQEGGIKISAEVIEGMLSIIETNIV